ncbi:MAG: hypothetical protein J2P50_16280 [Hyphomicrobiaceae bacterium]|nr:hypothetical protein [Hyphomicrobiaceae bacterium]
MRARYALLVFVAIPAFDGLVAPAEAGSRAWRKEPRSGYVTAESRYSSATITAPVRLNAQGRREVRLPGGTWIECRQTCTNTLRQETIDFWYIRSNPLYAGGDDGPGYLTFRFRW